jgi:murein DD-endopeptidase MepM/ murein hydrolase activator NlpD
VRAKTARIFVLGFAFGVLALGAGLWFSGSLRISPVQARNPLPVLNVITPPPPAPAVPSPAEVAVPTPGAGESPLPHLAMPIAGVNPDKLIDTFNEMHDGHKHEALDILAPRGTPVLAVAEGMVVKLFTSKLGGLTVYQFDDSRTYCYYYAHLDRYAAGLKENTLLRMGEVLGYVGSTGNASPEAPHLHFAVTRLGPDKEWWRGTAIDPLPLLRHSF